MALSEVGNQQLPIIHTPRTLFVCNEASYLIARRPEIISKPHPSLPFCLSPPFYPPLPLLRQEPRAALIMDEVDGMSGGDRGGVSDLIDSIKSSRVPIICICNDRYSQKLKSLLNHVLPLNYRKPTKQQVCERWTQNGVVKEGTWQNER